MDKYTRSAIIGYHLSGASIEQIIIILHKPYYVVAEIIALYVEDKERLIKYS